MQFNQRGIIFAGALFLAMLNAFALHAKHIIGGDITYEYVGDAGTTAKKWRFTMKVYRDCKGGGAPFDSDASIAIYYGRYDNNSPYDDFKLNYSDFTELVPDTPKCVTQIPDVCVEQAVYIFERTLPISKTGDSYFIVYQRCCRNESITNIQEPGSVGATFMVELTHDAQILNNNSPVFTNFPPIIICNNLPIDFDHSATDKDGDFILYEFCAPFAGGGPIVQGKELSSCIGAKPDPSCPPPFDLVQFIVPTYTPTAPMAGNPLITINTQTGRITGTPTKNGQYVVAVCANEYHNGQLISTIKREFQFNVTNCNPDVYTKIATDSITFSLDRYVIKSCGSKTIQFDNQSGKPKFIKEFRWEFDMLGNTVVDTDNWSPSFTFPDTGLYKGTLILNPNTGECSDTANIVVKIYPSIHADFSYAYDTCVAGPVSFKDLSTGEANINYWRWQYGINETTFSNDQNPAYQFPFPGDIPVKLYVLDNNICSDTEIKTIHWFPAPPLIVLAPDTYLGCAPADIFFDNLSMPIDSTYKIEWTFGDGGTASNIISPRHLYTDLGRFDVGVDITSPIGCHISKTFYDLIKVVPSPIADFSIDPEEGLTTFNNTIQLTDKSQLAYRWNWLIGPNYITTEQNPVYSFPDTGLQKIRLIVTHQEGCKDSLIRYVDVRPEVRWFMPNAFTPNSDGKNEGFLGKGFLEGATKFQMSIWNRWGELVFQTTDPTEAWNGRQRNTGGMSPPGVYVYVVSFTGPRGEPYEYKGYATLVR